MISLRKHIEDDREEMLRSTLNCYGSLVAAMADSGASVCPTVADPFQQNLLVLRDRLWQAEASGEVAETQRQLERELDGWGARARDYYQRKASEIREIMLAMTEAAQAVGERDKRYGLKFSQVSARLQEIGNLEDLTRIRAMIEASAAELRSSVDRMKEEGCQNVARLTAQVVSYQERLGSAERASSTDSLTGLANRAGIERDMAIRLQGPHPFCVMMVDLNGFKRVNDTHGHAAGDALLQAFATEFKAQFRPLDTVGRWGGDEFVAVLDCAAATASSRVARVRRWAFGDYPISAGAGKVNIAVTGAVGLAEWSPGKSAEQVFAEADAAMYAAKGLGKGIEPLKRKTTFARDAGGESFIPNRTP